MHFEVEGGEPSAMNSQQAASLADCNAAVASTLLVTCKDAPDIGAQCIICCWGVHGTARAVFSYRCVFSCALVFFLKVLVEPVLLHDISDSIKTGRWRPLGA